MKIPCILLCLTVLGCSSKSREDETAAPAGSKPSSETRAETETPGSDDARSKACHHNGDGAICMAAADHAIKAQRKHVAFELYALACSRGNGAGCAANAKPSRTPSLWYGRACRRGHQPSCNLGDAWAAKLGGRAKASAELPSWLAHEYERVVEDCAAELPKALRDAAGSVSLRVDKDAIAVTGVEPAPMSGCVGSAVGKLRRPTSGPHAVVVTLEAKAP